MAQGNHNPDNWSPEFADNMTAHDKTKPREGRCNAKRSNGTFCHKYPAKGRTRCKWHGGATLTGVDHPQFIDGRSSKYMPKRLFDKYKESLEDPKLLQLRNEIAIIDSRISELLGSLDESVDTSELWYEVKKKVHTSLRLMREGRKGPLETALRDLVDIVETGAAEHEKWDHILDAITHRRKSVESERKRLVETHQMISTEQALVMIQGISESIKRNVDDRRALQQIGRDIARIAAGSTIESVNGRG